MIALLKSGKSISSKLSRYIGHNFGCFFRDPKLFFMRKMARVEFIRDLVGKTVGTNVTLASISEQGDTLYVDLNRALIDQTLESEGYYVGMNLPQGIIDEIVDFAHSTECFGDRNSQYGFKIADKNEVEKRCNKKFMLGSYMGAVSSCSAFQKIANDPTLLSIASRYLGGTPVCIEYELCWSFPVSATLYEQLKAAQVFHYDIDDYRSIKFFFYLTDVDSTSGPHVFLRGTHRHKKFSHQVLGERCANIADQKLIDCYGKENVVAVIGPAGTGFAGDTFCFHKGTLPTGRNRLLLQLEFTLHKYNGVRNC